MKMASLQYLYKQFQALLLRPFRRREAFTPPRFARAFLPHHLSEKISRVSRIRHASDTVTVTVPRNRTYSACDFPLSSTRDSESRDLIDFAIPNGRVYFQTDIIHAHISRLYTYRRYYGRTAGPYRDSISLSFCSRIEFLLL